jgi:hypothetical protein
MAGYYAEEYSEDAEQTFARTDLYNQRW